MKPDNAGSIRVILMDHTIARECEFQLGIALAKRLAYPPEARTMGLDDFSKKYVEPYIEKLMEKL